MGHSKKAAQILKMINTLELHLVTVLGTHLSTMVTVADPSSTNPVQFDPF